MVLFSQLETASLVLVQDTSMRGLPHLPRCSQQPQTFFATDGWPGGAAIALMWAAGRPSEGEERPPRNLGP